MSIFKEDHDFLTISLNFKSYKSRNTIRLAACLLHSFRGKKTTFSGLDRSTSLVSSIQDADNPETPTPTNPVSVETPTSSTTNSFFGFLSGKSRKNSSTIQNQQQVGL